MLRNRRRWVVTSLVLVISAVAYVDRVNLSVAAPVLTKEFHTNAAVMGLLLSSFTWSYALLNIPAGMLVDRIRTRFLYSGAMVLWGIASFLTVLTNSVGALFGPRLLLGVAESPFIPASVRTLSDWLPKEERGRGGGVFISGVALGSAVGPPILGWLVSGHGWRSAFIATGVLSFIFAIFWFLWYRHPSEDRKLSDSERAHIRAGQEPDRPEGQARAPWSTLIRSRDIWAITGGYFCLLYIQYTFVSWLPSYLVQDRHMTVLKSGFATSVPWTCAFLVAVIFGRTSDVLMRRGWSALNARKVVLVGGMLAALAIIGTAFSSSATSAIIWLSISTSGIVLANGAAWAATQDVTRRLNLAGSASGFINGISNVGGILGPIVTGALVYATNSFVVPLLVAAGVALTGALIWLIGIRARPEQTAGAEGAGVAGAGVGGAGVAAAGLAGAGLVGAAFAAAANGRGSGGPGSDGPGSDGQGADGPGADGPGSDGRGSNGREIDGRETGGRETGGEGAQRHGAHAKATVGGVPVPGPREGSDDDHAPSGKRKLVLVGAAVVALIVAGLALYPALHAGNATSPPLAERDAAQGAGQTPNPAALEPGQPAPSPVPEVVPGEAGVPGENGVPGQAGVPGENGVAGVPGQGSVPGQAGVPGRNGVPGLGGAPAPEQNQVRGESPAQGHNGAPGAGRITPGSPSIAAPRGRSAGTIQPVRAADVAGSSEGGHSGQEASRSGGGGSGNGGSSHGDDKHGDDRHGDGDHGSGGGHGSGDRHRHGGDGDGSDGWTDDSTDDDEASGILDGVDLAPPTGLLSGLLGQ